VARSLSLTAAPVISPKVTPWTEGVVGAGVGAGEAPEAGVEPV